MALSSILTARTESSGQKLTFIKEIFLAALIAEVSVDRRPGQTGIIKKRVDLTSRSTRGFKMKLGKAAVLAAGTVLAAGSAHAKADS